MNNPKLKQQVDNRRTFAIISGCWEKTTYRTITIVWGGYPSSRDRKAKTGNFAKSDWMEIEKQRGISVTSSVMQFDYQGNE